MTALDETLDKNIAKQLKKFEKNKKIQANSGKVICF